jgi:hypothetical protein
MNRYPAKPVRLVDLPPERDLVGVSALVRAAATPPKEIASAARQRIRARLYGALAGRGRDFHHRWRPALILVLTLAVGGVVGAATHSVIIKRLSPKQSVEPKQVSAPSGNRRISMRSTPSAPPAGEEPQAAYLPESSPADAVPAAIPSTGMVPAESAPAAIPLVETVPAKAPPRAPAVASRSALPHSLPAASPSSRVPAPPHGSLSPPVARTDGIRPPAEASLLAAAIRKLRVDGDATAALSLLDQRRARFTDSALGPEASAVRIEALLKLGRVDDALSDLERLPLHAVPRRDEWHVVRGELRAQAGRWSSAEADFTAVLSGHLRDADGDLAERALWGRAAARSHQGDLAGARADSSEYLRRFPRGRFAGQASQALLGTSSR